MSFNIKGCLKIHFTVHFTANNTVVRSFCKKSSYPATTASDTSNSATASLLENVSEDPD